MSGGRGANDEMTCWIKVSDRVSNEAIDAYLVNAADELRNEIIEVDERKMIATSTITKNETTTGKVYHSLQSP